MLKQRIAAATAALVLAGCGGGGLTTGSLGKMLGGGDSKQAAAAPAAPVVRNDPMARAFQVGGTAARAQKCGYNFDPQRLRQTYFAYETQSGASPDDLAKAEKIYTVAYNGVAKAAAGDPGYCTEQRVASIKADLSRHLAGDYTPSPPKEKPEEDGLFSFGNWSSSSGDRGPIAKHPMDDR